MRIVAKLINMAEKALEEAPKQVKGHLAKALEGDAKSEQEVRKFIGQKAPQQEVDAIFGRAKYIKDRIVDPESVHPYNKKAQILSNQSVIPAQADKIYGTRGNLGYKKLRNNSRESFIDYTPRDVDSTSYFEHSYVLPEHIKQPGVMKVKDHFGNPAGAHVRGDTKNGIRRVFEIQSDALNSALKAQKQASTRELLDIAPEVDKKGLGPLTELRSLREAIQGFQSMSPEERNTALLKHMSPDDLALAKKTEAEVRKSPDFKAIYTPFKYNINWTKDMINRQFMEAANNGQDVLHFIISDERMNKTRSEGVQKWYATQYLKTIQKQAKKIGAETHFQGGRFESPLSLAILEAKQGDSRKLISILEKTSFTEPVMEDLKHLTAKYLGIPVEDVSMFSDVVPNVENVVHKLDPTKYKTMKSKLVVKLAKGATGILPFTMPAFAEDHNSSLGKVKPKLLPIVKKVRTLIENGGNITDVKQALANKFDSHESSSIIVAAVNDELKVLKKQGLSNDQIQEFLKVHGLTSPVSESSKLIQNPLDKPQTISSPR